MQEVEQEMAVEARQGIAIVIRGALYLTPSVLRLAIKAALGILKLAARTAALPVTLPMAAKKKLEAHQNAEHHGQQTVKQLARKGKGLQSIEVNKGTVGDFNRIARKYGVDFAPYKVKGERTYMIFFKAQDKDALTAAFEEYTRKRERKASRPSLRQKLAKLKNVSLSQKRGIHPELSR